MDWLKSSRKSSQVEFHLEARLTRRWMQWLLGLAMTGCWRWTQAGLAHHSDHTRDETNTSRCSGWLSLQTSVGVTNSRWLPHTSHECPFYDTRQRVVFYVARADSWLDFMAMQTQLYSQGPYILQRTGRPGVNKRKNRSSDLRQGPWRHAAASK